LESNRPDTCRPAWCQKYYFILFQSSYLV